jgi:prepilin-type N-terminal cleavage/methylation domain-containing protein
VTRRAGFTLVEVLVGLAVGSLALLAGMSALGFISERSRAAEEAALIAIGGATQRALLVDWLGGARYRAATGEQFEGLQQEEDGELRDMILFPTTARTPLAGTSTVIGLYIDTDPDTPERGLVAEMTGMTFGLEPRRMQLVPEAAVLRLRYLPGDGSGVWEDTWVSRNALPRVIELSLEPAAGDSLPLLLRYPIRVALAGVQ